MSDGEFQTADGRAKLICDELGAVPRAAEPRVTRSCSTPAARSSTGTPAPRPAKCRSWSACRREAWLEMNPRDAKKLGLRSHDRVDIVSRRGRVRGVELRLTEIIAPGQVFMPFHYSETNVERRYAKRLRPDLARAELQAVRGARGDEQEHRNEENCSGRKRHGRRRLRGADPQATGTTSTSRSSATRPTSTTTASCSRRCWPAKSPPTRSCSTTSIGTSANGIEPRLGVRVTEIDREAHVVSSATTASARRYDKLILATGSSAFIPPIPGVDKENVHVFRTLDDTRALLEKSRPGRKAVVIGGGLLGLEAARGLQVQGCDVTVVHLARHPDGAAARLDRRHVPAPQDGKPGRPRAARQADAGAARQRPRRRLRFA